MKISDDDYIRILNRRPVKGPESLFRRFLMDKVRGYSEPQRKGTPKGEPVGIFREKFNASLLMLTNISQKQVAELLGISHGVLRKWGTEKQFKEIIEKHCDEFTEIIVKFFMSKLDSFAVAVNKQRAKGDEIKIPDPKFSELSDANVYGECILNSIKDKAYSTIQRFPLAEFSKAFLIQFLLMTTFFKPDQKYTTFIRKMERVYILRMVKRLSSLMENLEEGRKAEVSFIINKIEGFIERDV